MDYGEIRCFRCLNWIPASQFASHRFRGEKCGGAVTKPCTVCRVKPTFGSLFSGIGGMDLGLERAGWTCKWQCETDDFCNAVLAQHWPGVVRYGDIRELTSPEPVDLLCGGFPCQDISVAGKGAGLGGARSGLWWEMWRLIQKLRPAWVLVENVPALRTRGADAILDALDSEGYACWPCVVGAEAIGAPHRRKRVWLVAHTYGLELWKQCGGSSGKGRKGKIITWNNGAARSMARHPQNAWAIEPDVGRVAYGIPARVDRLRALGNAVVPANAEILGRAILRCMS
jgi:DNA (cytosine-5)-methyltransferase 1